MTERKIFNALKLFCSHFNVPNIFIRNQPKTDKTYRGVKRTVEEVRRRSGRDYGAVNFQENCRYWATHEIQNTGIPVTKYRPSVHASSKTTSIHRHRLYSLPPLVERKRKKEQKSNSKRRKKKKEKRTGTRGNKRKTKQLINWQLLALFALDFVALFRQRARRRRLRIKN